MGDAIFLVDDLLHRDATHRTEIVRLAARRWIERRAVQVGFISADPHHLRLEAAQVGVGIVEPLRHWMFRSRVLVVPTAPWMYIGTAEPFRSEERRVGK